MFHPLLVRHDGATTARYRGTRAMCSAISSPTALPTRLRVRLATLALALFANAFAMSNPFPCAQLPVKPAAWSATRLTPSLSADTPSSRLTPPSRLITSSLSRAQTRRSW